MFLVANLRWTVPICLALWASTACGDPAPATVDALGIHIPSGFEITRFADDALAHDIHCLAIDGRGRVAVSGPGYIKFLLDEDGDGRADRSKLFSEKPASGAQGMLFDGRDLLYTGDGKLAWLRDRDQDDVADPIGAREEVWARLQTSEHGAHNIVRGPDGWIYVVCGNEAGVSQKHITSPTSPIADPVCGAILRFSPDGRRCEVFADGFRNPYGLDFDAEGRLYTVDSDNERDQHLPWYCPTRLFAVAAGRSHGWLANGAKPSWNRPATAWGSAPRLVEIGRGSPTGVLVRKQPGWPARYQRGVFSACWTLGRIYFLPLRYTDSSVEAGQEIFLEGAGNTGLAIVAMALDPRGDLYFAVGGRQTQGGVFRVRYVGAPEKDPVPGAATRREDPPPANPRADRNSDSLRVTRLELAPAAARLLAQYRAQSERAWEAVGSFDRRDEDQWLALLRLWQQSLGDVPDFSARPEVFVGYQAAPPAGSRPDAGLPDALQPAAFRPAAEAALSLAKSFPTPFAEVNRELARLLAMLQVQDPQLVSRILLQCGEGTAVTDDLHYLIVSARLPGPRSTGDTEATANALARLHHKMAAEARIPSRNWPRRVTELLEQLCRRDDRLAAALVDEPKFGLPDQGLFLQVLPKKTRTRGARRLLAAAQDPDVEWSADLIRALQILPRSELSPVLRDRWEEPALRDTIASYLAEVPEEEDRGRLVASLKSVQSEVVRKSAAALLRLRPAAEPADLAVALASLRQYCTSPHERPTRQALVALLGHWSGQPIKTEEPLPPDSSTPADRPQGNEPLALYQPWFDWFASAYPAQAAALVTSGADSVAWNARLAAIDWTAGDAARGKAVFAARACQRCHAGASRLGPDLAGAAARFSREDLFAAIYDPNRDVAPPYRTTSVFTPSGETHHGLIVYESPDGTLLQTGPDTTVRLTGIPPSAMRPSRVSLMPTGLLADAQDQELADLFAYLKSLR